MPKTILKVGPKDHGRRMSLEDFDHCEVQEGYRYELSRGVIIVSDVPDRRHLVQVQAIRRQFYGYDARHPGRIDTIAARGECKILLLDLDTERHPDLAIYKAPPADETNLWATWIPDIVIEVVSLSSDVRDYVEKREEYLLFGVKEYWIVDAERREMLVLRRADDEWEERVVRPPKLYRTRLLPGLAFDCALVFQAAGAVGE